MTNIEREWHTSVGRRCALSALATIMNRYLPASFLALLVLVLLPAAGSAQSGTSGTLAGVVKDPTGAVIPGVTVEAASPALIEKVRSVTTDDQGQYKIVELRP